MIASIICALLIIPLWHYFWESIFLPSYRLKMRFRLFAIRDELRTIRISNPSILDESTFCEAERRINASIRLLPIIDPHFIESCYKELKADKKLSESLDKKLSAFELKAPAQVIRITDEATKIGITTALANSGGWIIYALPIGVAAIGFKKLSMSFRELAIAPPHKVEAFAHCEPQVE